MSDLQIIEVKQLRLLIKDILSRLYALDPSRERLLCRTKLQEASMWLGMDLRRMDDDQTCYQVAEDASTTEVDPPQPEAPVNVYTDPVED